MRALDEIRSLMDRPDPYAAVTTDLRALQLEAVRERFEEQRGRLRILDRRAREGGISEIRRFDDLIPLLFSHVNYKSYPDAFLDQGQWGNMNLWLQTMSCLPVKGVNVEGVRDADDWLARLEAAGHFTYASSGTSGKCSFIDQTADDVAVADKAFDVAFLSAWAPVVPARDRTAFSTFPPRGAHRFCRANARFMRDRVAPAGAAHFLSDDPLLVTPGIRAGRLRRELAAGTALPDDIATFEAENAARSARMEGRLTEFIDLIHASRHQPMALGVQWPQALQIVEGLLARGARPGDVHPDTVLHMGGGIKGVKLPSDFKEQVQRFFGLPETSYFSAYGMVEMTGLCPYRHDLGGFAFAPWIVPLVLDKEGQQLLNPADGRGVVEGRMALFDLVVDAHWGGVISGDKVSVDFSPGSGLAGPLIRSVARYQDLEEGEDKLTCAGTIDSYVRGEIRL
jgi:hypothetical protein